MLANHTKNLICIRFGVFLGEMKITEHEKIVTLLYEIAHNVLATANPI